MVGEYGIEMKRRDAPKYINNLYSIFDELMLSGTIWEASMSATLWNNRDKCIFDPDGAVRPGTRALDRPYPRAVAGVITSFGFNPENALFEMRFIEDPLIKLPTEIYLPERVYNMKPGIHIEPDGEFSFNPENRVLSIPPLNKKGQRRVLVSP